MTMTTRRLANIPYPHPAPPMSDKFYDQKAYFNLSTYYSMSVGGEETYVSQSSGGHGHQGSYVEPGYSGDGTYEDEYVEPGYDSYSDDVAYGGGYDDEYVEPGYDFYSDDVAYGGGYDDEYAEPRYDGYSDDVAHGGGYGKEQGGGYGKEQHYETFSVNDHADNNSASYADDGDYYGNDVYYGSY